MKKIKYILCLIIGHNYNISVIDKNYKVIGKKCDRCGNGC